MRTLTAFIRSADWFIKHELPRVLLGTMLGDEVVGLSEKARPLLSRHLVVLDLWCLCQFFLLLMTTLSFPLEGLPRPISYPQGFGGRDWFHSLAPGLGGWFHFFQFTVIGSGRGHDPSQPQRESVLELLLEFLTPRSLPSASLAKRQGGGLEILRAILATIWRGACWRTKPEQRTGLSVATGQISECITWAPRSRGDRSTQEFCNYTSWSIAFFSLNQLEMGFCLLK